MPQIDWSESETSSGTNSMTMSHIFSDRLITTASSHSSDSSKSSIDWILNRWPKAELKWNFKWSHNLIESEDNPLFNIKLKLALIQKWPKSYRYFMTYFMTYSMTTTLLFLKSIFSINKYLFNCYNYNNNNFVFI